jgi:hypothetical protein
MKNGAVTPHEQASTEMRVIDPPKKGFKTNKVIEIQLGDTARAIMAEAERSGATSTNDSGETIYQVMFEGSVEPRKIFGFTAVQLRREVRLFNSRS